MRNFSPKLNSAKQQQGVSLIEILLALALGIVILLGATRAFKQMVSSSNIQLNNNTMQRTADMALSHLSYRLRNATAMPCASIQQLQQTGKINIHDLTGGKGKKRISATHQAVITKLFQGSGITSKQKNITVNNQTLHTDNLTFLTAKERFLVNHNVTTTPKEITLSTKLMTKPTGLLLPRDKTDHPFLITNCKQADVFLAKAFYKKSKGRYNFTINTTNSPQFNSTYPNNTITMVSPLNINTIDIDDQSNLSDKLIFDKSTGNTLMNDVVLMRIIFGIDSTGNDGVADKYLTTKQLPSIGDTEIITSMNISLLVQAPRYQRHLNVPASYSVQLPDTSKAIPNSGIIPMQTITFKDRILRKVFTQTITLRN